jgi:hypothetical protein
MDYPTDEDRPAIAARDKPEIEAAAKRAAVVVRAVSRFYWRLRLKPV